MGDIKKIAKTGDIFTNRGLNTMDKYREKLYYFDRVTIHDFDTLAGFILKEVPDTVHHELRYHVVRVTIETVIVGVLAETLDLMDDLETELDKLSLTDEEQVPIFDIFRDEKGNIWEEGFGVLKDVNPIEVFGGWINAMDDVGYQVVIYSNKTYIEPGPILGEGYQHG